MNYTTMKEVTKDEFFGIINEGKLDVLVRPETKEPGHWYPHTIARNTVGVGTSKKLRIFGQPMIVLWHLIRTKQTQF